MINGKLVVRPGLEEQDSNRILQKLAITLQIALETFDRVTCRNHIWNKTFKNKGNALITDIEKINKNLFEARYREFQEPLNYTSKATESFIEEVQYMYLEDLNDMMGFAKVLRADRENNTKYCEQFLLEQTERINKQLEK